MSKIEIPTDVLDIIFSYKKQFDLINVVKELKTIKNKCPNCDKNKICMYDCRKCLEKICFECRYADLNDGIVDKNDFELFYKCDECDMEEKYHLIEQKSDDDYESSDYYNNEYYARSWDDCI